MFKYSLNYINTTKTVRKTQIQTKTPKQNIFIQNTKTFKNTHLNNKVRARQRAQSYRRSPRGTVDCRRNWNTVLVDISDDHIDRGLWMGGWGEMVQG